MSTVCSISAVAEILVEILVKSKFPTDFSFKTNLIYLRGKAVQ